MNNLRNGLSWLRCNDDTVSHGGKSRVLAEKATDFPVFMVRNPRQRMVENLVAFSLMQLEMHPEEMFQKSCRVDLMFLREKHLKITHRYLPKCLHLSTCHSHKEG